MEQQLYQDYPRQRTTYTQHKDRRLTYSLESYNNGVSKKAMMLHWNHRKPTWMIVWNLLEVFTVDEIKSIRTKVFRILRDAGIIAFASIEITRDEFGDPSNRVHYHFLSDDPRSKEELEELFNTACERVGLVKGEDFRVACEKVRNADHIIDYVTKRNREDEVILFQPGTGLQKFYTIGDWFVNADGTPTTQAAIWEKIKMYMQEKNLINQEKKLIHREKELIHREMELIHEEKKLLSVYKNMKVVSPQVVTHGLNNPCTEIDEESLEENIPFDDTEYMETRQWQEVIECDPLDQPADKGKLQEILNAVDDDTLQVWQDKLLGRQIRSGIVLPNWLTKVQGRKRIDLLTAIDARLRSEYATYTDDKVEEDLIYHPAAYDTERDECYLEEIYHISENKSYTIDEYIALQTSVKGQRARLPSITNLVPAEELQAIFGNLDRFSLLRG